MTVAESYTLTRRTALKSADRGPDGQVQMNLEVEAAGSDPDCAPIRTGTTSSYKGASSSACSNGPSGTKSDCTGRTAGGGGGRWFVPRRRLLAPRMETAHLRSGPWARVALKVMRLRVRPARRAMRFASVSSRSRACTTGSSGGCGCTISHQISRHRVAPSLRCLIQAARSSKHVKHTIHVFPPQKERDGWRHP